MAKAKLLFRGPVLTSSGYGVHARQVLRALVESDDYEVSVETIKWGETPFIYGREVDWISPFVARRRSDPKDARYDVSVQITIPNEFERRARFNVGVTAGIEVDAVSAEWIHKTNQNVDLLIVPSTHSLNAFKAVYRTQNGEELRLSVNAVVVPEGFDPEHFNVGDGVRSPLLSHLDTELNLLHVGLGLDKGMGEDRKNISNLVRWFLEEFKGEPDKGLVLKTSIVNNSLMDFELLKKKIGEIREGVGCGEFPRIHLVHGRLTDAELASIYKDPRVAAFVSLTHGEGFGLPLLEAAACGLPVIATNWSGHLDFLKVAAFAPVAFDMAAVPKSAVWNGVIDEGRGWANPREADAKKVMRQALADIRAGRELARERRKAVAAYEEHKVAERLVEVLRAARASFVKARPETREDLVKSVRTMIFDDADTGKRLIFTMPMSGGDVFLSTGVVASLKRRFPDHKIFFATQPQYRSILEGNPDIHKVIDWQVWMQDVGVLEDLFDEVYTPNLAIQMTYSNWVHRGKGRQLMDEMFAQCGVDDSEKLPPRIDRLDFDGLPASYVVIHTGSGKGQWSARNYRRWQDVVDNASRFLKDVRFVQVGREDEPALKGCMDLRGKTYDYRELAGIIAHANAFVGIDSVCMHIAHHLDVHVVALFGGSYAQSTGPLCDVTSPRTLVRLKTIETPDRNGCDRACYKNECKVDRDDPCINNIDPADVVEELVWAITDDHDLAIDAHGKFVESVPKISGYVHILNPLRNSYPYVASIKSMLGFCREVVVVDGGSDDGTLGFLEDWAKTEPRIKVFVNRWDPDEPGMDGMQKAFGRAMCDSDSEFLWQQDADEVVHEEDYAKILDLCRKFPADQLLMHLPVVELWGDRETVRTDRHAWKWRLSRNDFRVTHGIVGHARVLDDATGRVYAKKGQSDGCEYIDVMTGEYVPHFGFWSQELESLRVSDPEKYGRRMNEVFAKLPSVFHYSWSDIPRKIRNFKTFWNTQWSRLYRDAQPEDRFPEADPNDPGSMALVAETVRSRGGEHGQAATFPLGRNNPKVMEEEA